jgi:homoisocitrate dehydrogenase
LTFDICLIPGDGIGQEVVPATVEALKALRLGLRFVEAEAGFECFKRCGEALPEATLDAVRRADAVLFGATSSPPGGMKGYRSPILALRQELNLYANLRPCQSLPGDFSQPGIDLLIVRENSEGLYSGRERREGDTAIAERVITRAASERIMRMACEQAMSRARLGKSPVVTIVHKANVLKVSDGLFRECVLRVAQECLRVTVQELLVDAAAMKLVKSPQSFDVLVTTNLFGDILSDEASALVGGLGVAPSANVGEGTPVFEPVHGSAPDIEGKGIANPVGAMLSAAMMLDILGQAQAARRLREVVHATLAARVCTPDLGGSATTAEFTRAICRRLVWD